MSGDRKDIHETYISEDTSMSDLWNVWYSELHDGLSGLTIKVDRIVESINSPYQRIDVLKTKDFGKILVLYGSLMVCEKDNNAYNEMLAHVPLFVHPSPKRVLIIGGGDCGCLSEVLEHPEVESVTMCELDEAVVEISRRHFPHLTRGLDDPRANVVFRDGKKFIEETDEKFDVILMDLSDPVGPAADLFQKSFHAKMKDRLADGGILVPQTESPYYNERTVRALFKNLGELFPICRMYTCFMPIYPSAYWSFAFCSLRHDPLEDFDQDRWGELGLKTSYYNAEVHRGCFALPQFVRDMLAS